MNSSEILLWLTLGLALGGVYFAGLWWSVCKATASSRPASWLLVSFIVRAIAAVGVLALVARHGWQGLAITVAGFLFARLAAVRLVITAASRQA